MNWWTGLLIYGLGFREGWVMSLDVGYIAGLMGCSKYRLVNGMWDISINYCYVGYID